MVPEAALVRLARPDAEIRMGGNTRRLPFRRSPWVLGEGVAGSRAGTILLAPTAAQTGAIRQQWPNAALLIAESLDADIDGRNLTMLPRMVPVPFYPPGEGADLFGVTRRLHLEERPRLVYFGGHQSGPGLTAILETAKELFRSGGELVFWEGLDLRDRLAPVIKHLRLTERVVFAPKLEMTELSALLLGADAMVVWDREPVSTSLVLTWAMATGNPIIARHSPANEAVLGSAALWVYEDSPEVFYSAIQQALSSESLREVLARRQSAITRPWRLDLARPYWVQALPE